ncbi:uncharacterized protein EV422DRAFT_540918 [Fimicolochytrium jonesii]|uniref:uncharacterized protein n=1 Tax=Fimicolochytrium jonesii TaxID=1396493 RepID=UPI0022FE3CCE|nr:uncharacterized protein EV422DRAFT_540918 [Fimicolochytrium jonesii]KAI8817502.1 hypothetical protein EV422DRAFT_540918 [Fimicolochytrium jonesii]
MPSIKTLALTAGAILLSSSFVAAQNNVHLGAACTPAQDQFGCDGVTFVSCDKDQRKWITQNLCTGPCINDPPYSSLCSSNSQVGPLGAGAPAATTSNPATPATTNAANPAGSTGGAATPNPASSGSAASATANPSSTATPTTNNSNANQDPNASSSSSSSHIGAIIGGIVGALVLLALIAAFFIYRRRKTTGSATNTPLMGPTPPVTFASAGKQEMGEAGGAGEGSSSSAIGGIAAGLSVASVLEKNYVVRHDYQPAAEDEVQLKVGDRIRLDLLFNDGWAKGTNETTGQQGLLPVACLQDA